MTDRDLAAALEHAAEVERASRAHWTASSEDVPERDAAIMVMRHSTALKRSIEQWIAARSVRALKHTA